MYGLRLLPTAFVKGLVKRSGELQLAPGDGDTYGLTAHVNKNPYAVNDWLHWK